MARVRRHMRRPRRFHRRFGKRRGFQRRVARIVRSIRPSRMNYADDVIYTGQAFTTSAVYSQLMNVPGYPVTATVGIGARPLTNIYIKAMDVSVLVRGAETNVLFSADIFNRFSILIGYIKKNNNNTLITASGSRESPFDTSTITNELAPYAPIGYDYKQNFHKLARWHGVVAGLDTGSSSTAAVPYVKDHVWQKHKLFKFHGKGLECTFVSTANGIVAFNTSVPVIAAISDSGVTPNPILSVSCRIWYNSSTY